MSTNNKKAPVGATPGETARKIVLNVETAEAVLARREREQGTTCSTQVKVANDSDEFTNPWELSLDETHYAVRVLNDALELLAERSAPLDSHGDVELEREMYRGNAYRETGAEAGGGEFSLSRSVSLLFGVEFRFVAAELFEKFRQRDADVLAGGQVDGRVREVLPVYDNRGDDVQGFILARVGEPAGARVYPVVLPAHVIDFSVASLGPAAYRIRFLCELTRIYRDAVGLLSDSEGFHRLLLTSLGNLVSALRIQLGPSCQANADQPSDTT